MEELVDLMEAEEMARQMIVDKIEDWYDLTSSGKPVFESSETCQSGDLPVYVLKGYVDVEFKTGWLSSARERSRSGRVLFTVRLNAQNGKVLSVKHRAEQE
jgi:hypothetical protein